MWNDIARAIAAVTGAPFFIDSRKQVTGGCINESYVVAGAGARYFVKTNVASRLPMFEAEARGLEALAGTKTVRVPQPVAFGAASERAWLVLEHAELRRRDPRSDARLGAALAALHRTTSPTFGWDRDNTIGSTPQANPRRDRWPEFWREARLAPQLARARAQGYGGRLQKDGEALLSCIESFFEAYAPVPSLLHGDLWSGNAAADTAGAPVIYDPAVYYGDREADVAMTELFGGYAKSFYSAYREAFPLDPGYETRRDLYNLYHVLNHLNLFGRSYLGQAQRLLETLVGRVER